MDTAEWRTLQHNAQQNRTLFAKAHLADDQVQTVRCTGCPCWERAYFWTAVREKGTSVLLECPACGDYRVRYDLRRNQVAHPFSPRLLAKLAFGAVVALSLLTAGMIRRPNEAANLSERAGEEIARLFPATEWRRAEPPSGTPWNRGAERFFSGRGHGTLPCRRNGRLCRRRGPAGGAAAARTGRRGLV